LYSFGYGLSYTTFKYSEISLSSILISPTDSISVSVDITNSGNYDGHEVVQLYIHDKVGSITRPIKELKDFKKVFIKKGETKTVKFKLFSDSFKFFNGEDYVLEAGEFEVAIAGSSNFNFSHSFHLKF
jgi:beta-glucosidase